ncbi:MAG: fibronectin type III domain-containing protein [Clostridiales bacterium]|nr:fibronectin type III domain-containing protein [Clostridiales bacterium]
MKKRFLSGLLSFIIISGICTPAATYADDSIAENEEADSLYTSDGDEAEEEFTVEIEPEDDTVSGTSVTVDETEPLSSDSLVAEDAKTNFEDGFTLGNTAENILNGGIIAYYGDDMYFSDESKGNRLCIAYENGEEDVISYENSSYINISSSGSVVYYLNDSSEIKAVNNGDITSIYTSENEISYLYLVNDTLFYYLENGDVYCFDTEEGINSEVTEGAGLWSFVPTEYGFIYVKGSLFNYDIYANDELIVSGVSTYYVADDVLVYSVDEEEKQIDVDNLFSGFSISDIDDYEYGTDEEIMLFSTDENETDNFDDAVILESSDEADADEDDTAFPVSLMSTGQENVVKRARQQLEIKWTPVKDVKSYKSQTTFKAGTTYAGIPYGQPCSAGAYVPHSYSLTKFISAVNSSTSKFYTSRGKNSYSGAACPYYSSDCSAFVSWSYGLSRMTTSTIGSSSTIKKVSSQSIYSAKVGDCLNKSGSHVVLIGGLYYNSSGTITKVVIMEQTPSKAKKTTITAASAQSKYINSGYVLRRYSNISSVSYKHYCVVPIDKDYCTSCAPKPSAPTISSVSPASTSSLTIKWKKVSYATSYDILRKRSDETSYTTIANVEDSSTTSSTMTYTNTGLKAGTKYYYKIKAKNSNGTATSSAVSNYTKPVTPTISSVVRNSNALTSSLIVTWGKVSSASSYIICRRMGSDDAYTQVTTTTDTTYTDTKLAAGTKYWYKIIAVKGGVNSDKSSAVGKYTKIEAPTVSKRTASAVTLKWNAANGAGAGSSAYTYEIYGKLASSGSYSSLSSAVTGTSTTASGLKAGTQYKLYIKVNNTVENTNPTNSNSIYVVTLCNAPKVSYVSSTSLKLSWSAINGTGSYRYDIYRKTGSGSCKKITSTTGTSYTDSGLAEDTSYTYKLYVFDTKQSTTTSVTYSAEGKGSTEVSIGSIGSTDDEEEEFDEDDESIEFIVEEDNETNDESEESDDETDDGIYIDSIGATDADAINGDGQECSYEVSSACVDENGTVVVLNEIYEEENPVLIAIEFDDEGNYKSYSFVEKTDWIINEPEDGETEDTEETEDSDDVTYTSYTVYLDSITSENVKIVIWESLETMKVLALSSLAGYSELDEEGVTGEEEYVLEDEDDSEDTDDEFEDNSDNTDAGDESEV